MPRTWLFGLGLAFAGCLSIEDARPGAEDGGDGGFGSGGKSDGGPDSLTGGSWSGDSASDAPAEVTFDAVVDAPPNPPDTGACSPGAPLMLDDFGQPDGQIGSAWTGDRNAFAVLAGQLHHVKPGNDDRILFAKTLCTTQTVSVRLMKVDPASGLVGVMFAAGSDNNCGLIQVGHSGNKQGILAQRCVNGKWTDLMSKAWPVFDGDRLEARLTAAGNLTALVNGVEVGSVSVGPWPGSHPGIAMFLGGTQAVLDEFKGG